MAEPAYRWVKFGALVQVGVGWGPVTLIGKDKRATEITKLVIFAWLYQVVSGFNCTCIIFTVLRGLRTVLCTTVSVLFFIWLFGHLGRKLDWLIDHYSPSVEHVSGIITKCAQSLHALEILRSHGMCDYALDVIYKAVVKVLHAIHAWWRFTAASNRQKLYAFIRRGVRLNFTTTTILPWLNLLMN